MNTAISIILFILTVTAAYMLWYLLLGRGRRAAQPGEKPAETAGGKEDKPPGKPGKASYRNPKINNVMGYEFISVVDVPKELLEGEKPTGDGRTPADGTDAPDWNGSKGIGLTAVPNGDPSGHSPEEDEPFPLPRERGRFNNRMPIFSEMPPPDDFSPEADINPAELEMLSRQSTVWPNRDFEDEFFDDEVINQVLNSNSDMIERHEPTDDDYLIHKELEAMKRIEETEKRMIEEQENAKRNEEISRSIMDQLEEDEAGETAGPPDENDIPDI